MCTGFAATTQGFCVLNALRYVDKQSYCLWLILDLQTHDSYSLLSPDHVVDPHIRSALKGMHERFSALKKSGNEKKRAMESTSAPSVTPNYPSEQLIRSLLGQRKRLCLRLQFILTLVRLVVLVCMNINSTLREPCFKKWVFVRMSFLRREHG